MKKKILFLAALYIVIQLVPVTRDCSLFINNCKAQWQPDVRLTNDTAISNMAANNARCIASIGDVVYTVWSDSRSGNREIYFKRSTDGGISWGTDTRLTNDTAISSIPSVAVFSTFVNVAWIDNRDGNTEIYFKRSTDGGTTWSSDTRLTNDPGITSGPSLAVSSSIVHVVWFDNRDGGNEVYYKRSTDGGIIWGADTRLTNDPAQSRYASVSVSGSVVHVVWDDTRDGINGEIYYKRSTDGGTTWGADTRLTNNTAESFRPSVSVYGPVVHTVWHDKRDGNYEIYDKVSTDGGTTWGADTRLTNASGNSVWASVSISGSLPAVGVHVAWFDDRDGNGEIYYKRSTDAGTTWGADARLTNNSSISEFPSVSISGSVVHVAWQDQRDGNYEIYYKHNPNGNVVGIKNINSDIPAEYKLNQNYPNPFNPKTFINYQLPFTNFVKLAVYGVTGKEVAVLVNDVKNAGTYSAEFDGSNLSSGVYFYKLIASDFTETKKMLLLK